MEGNMQKIILSFFMLFSMSSFACNYTDVSGAESITARQAIIDNKDNPGLRVAWKG